MGFMEQMPFLVGMLNWRQSGSKGSKRGFLSPYLIEIFFSSVVPWELVISLIFVHRKKKSNDNKGSPEYQASKPLHGLYTD